MLDTEYTVDAVEDEALDAALDEDTMFEDDTALDEEIMLDQEIMPGEDKIREDTALEDAMEEDAMLEETVLEDALLDAGVEDAMLEDTELDAAEVLDAMLDPTLDIGGALDMTLDTLGEGLIDALLEMMLDRTDDEELDGAELGTEHGWWEIMLLSRVTAPLRAYSFILIGAVTSSILALRWGGITLPWSDPKAWGCLLGFFLLVTIFVALQIRQKDRALIPVRILTQRTVAATCAIVTF
ncbi:hypothetical protein V8F06_010513 [Rhypophila decipiens]